MSIAEKADYIVRVEIPKKQGVAATIGWQFRMQRLNQKETKFFSDSKYGGKDKAFEAAIKYKEEKMILLNEYLGISRITDELAKHNTSGIIGVHRSESIRRRDEKIEEVWQSSCPMPNGKTHNQSFRIHTHGEFLAMYKAIECRLQDVSNLIGVEKYKGSEKAIRNLIEKYLNILIYLDSLGQDQRALILNVINSKEINCTEKATIIDGRVGQSSFREKLFKLFDKKCCVTGSLIMLQSSHIKPWSVSNDEERLDPFNGLLLSPLYDKAFDNGYIAFNDDGSMMISNALLNDSIIHHINKQSKIKVNEFNRKYLKYHRDNIFIW